MIYNKGDIIEIKELIFKDDFTPDPKGVRPALITLAVSEDNKYMYFLTLTSQTDKYFDRPECHDMYFLIKKSDKNLLKKSSLINLQNIYKRSVPNDDVVAKIQGQEYKKLIRKFKEWQEYNPDEFYEEIRDLL